MPDKSHAIFVCVSRAAHSYCGLAHTATGVVFMFLIALAGMAALVGMCFAVIAAVKA